MFAKQSSRRNGRIFHLVSFYNVQLMAHVYQRYQSWEHRLRPSCDFKTPVPSPQTQTNGTQIHIWVVWVYVLKQPSNETVVIFTQNRNVLWRISSSPTLHSVPSQMNLICNLSKYFLYIHFKTILLLTAKPFKLFPLTIYSFIISSR